MSVDNDDITRLFQSDINSKKKTSTGAFHRASRTGTIKGKMLTPVDLLKGKAKKEYMNNGEVIVYNMLDDIKNVKSFEEIMEMPLEEGKKYLENIRSRHTMSKLRKHWGVSTYAIYHKLFKKFNIKTNPIIQKPSETKEIEIPKGIALKTISRGFNIALNGTFTGEELVDRISSLTYLLTEGKKFNVEFSIQEVE